MAWRMRGALCCGRIVSWKCTPHHTHVLRCCTWTPLSSHDALLSDVWLCAMMPAGRRSLGVMRPGLASRPRGPRKAFLCMPLARMMMVVVVQLRGDACQAVHGR